VALVDRVSEMGVMRGLVAGARESSSGVLVLRGQAGMGKTALLRETADQAASAGMRVAQAVGIQAEMEMDFAGLHQLLLPFADVLPTLPVPQRAALESAFGLAAGQAPDRFLVGLATLTLLTDAAESQPVLCVVDDAQWLDRVSLEAGKELLETAAGARVAELTSRRVLAEAAGSPLALVELGSELAAGRRVPDTVPGQPLRLGERLELLYLNRVRELPSSAQTLLVLAAAEQLGEPETVWRAAAALGLDLGAAELPEVRRMLSLSPRVAFSHPLMRAAAYWGAPPGERRRVHGALAGVINPATDPDRRAWHLAEATDGPDEDVARELEASAGRARGRGGWENEEAFLERATRCLRRSAPPSLTAGSGRRTPRWLGPWPACPCRWRRRQATGCLTASPPSTRAARRTATRCCARVSGQWRPPTIPATAPCPACWPGCRSSRC